MSQSAAQASDAVRELLRRARCRESLHSYALNITIPTVGKEPLCPDEDLLGPAENFMAKHHAMILGVLERTMKRFMGRCMIFAPPGTAKSLYTSVLAPTWYMGRHPGARIIMTSYADELIERQSQRAMMIVESEEYRLLWPEEPTLVRDAASFWTLSNKSELIASGLLGGLTGNRANGAVIDDPVSGRKDADSEPMRKQTLNAYTDDLKTRLLPGAWLAFIMTRWHEQDLAGAILPEDYKGESGMITCRDGQVWEILNLEAKCERPDDPLGRKIGEYIWPEYYPVAHWHQYELASGAEAARTWSSLYQQRPSPQGDGRFNESMIDYYKPGTQPTILSYVGAGDYAVTSNGGDFTELGVFGIDPAGEWWEVDWEHGQWDTGKSAMSTIKMIQKWRLAMWFNEGGVIDKAMGPLFNLLMRQNKVYCDRRSIPSMADKVAKCASFRGRAASGGESVPGKWNPGVIHLRDTANSRRIVQQLVALPAGRYDDAADVCGLLGRAVDQFPITRVRTETPREQILPFTGKWVEHQEKTAKKSRYR